MSGHSKWHKIKRAKEATDQKKSQTWGKLIRDIQVAARIDSDPANNAALRDAIERARKANMPQANINRLLQKKESTGLNEVIYEGFGPEGIAVIVVAETDNPNRVVSAVRQIFKKNGGQLGTPGSVRWKFKDRLVITVSHIPTSEADDIELALIDAGAEEINKDAPDRWQVMASLPDMKNICAAADRLRLSCAPAEQKFVSMQAAGLTVAGRQQLTQLIKDLTAEQDIARVYSETVQ